MTYFTATVEAEVCRLPIFAIASSVSVTLQAFLGAKWTAVAFGFARRNDIRTSEERRTRRRPTVNRPLLSTHMTCEMRIDDRQYRQYRLIKLSGY